MHKLMCTFMTPMKKKIPDRNLDTSCPAGIPRKNPRAANKTKSSAHAGRRKVLGLSVTFKKHGVQ